MAGKPIVFIHGWSDHSGSFRNLARRLARETGRDTREVWLGDYISLDDDVRLDDLAAALDRAWHDAGLPGTANQVDAVVHSTGGLVIRAWMHRMFQARGKKPPIRNLVMLAPANFGSPLAHKGRSLIGRVFKGAKSDRPFQTGGQILRALEMASPISWQLAEQDRFAANVFSGGGVRCTVLVGNTGYSGIRGLVNEDGSDGTVYVSTANLNCAQLSIEVLRRDRGMDVIRPGRLRPSRGQTAFRVMDGFDHSEITGNERLPQSLLEPVLRALQVKASEFNQWCKDCERENARLLKKYARTRNTDRHAFQNTVFRLKDSLGAFVEDYALEFYGEWDDERDPWAAVFHRDIIGKVHAYGDNPAYRSFMMDITRLQRESDARDKPLRFSLSAQPDISDKDHRVGYKSVNSEDIGHMSLDREMMTRFFQAHRTLLVDIQLPRYQEAEVFRLGALEKAR